MNNQYEETWECYTSAWKAESAGEKKQILESCLDENCVYTDPLVQTRGVDELVEYMMDFHKQIPGGHFVTYYFLDHHDKSIVKWEMKNSEGAVLGDGVSYGEYNKQGKLVAMTGFYQT